MPTIERMALARDARAGGYGAVAVARSVAGFPPSRAFAGMTEGRLAAELRCRRPADPSNKLAFALQLTWRVEQVHFLSSDLVKPDVMEPQAGCVRVDVVNTNRKPRYLYVVEFVRSYRLAVV